MGGLWACLAAVALAQPAPIVLDADTTEFDRKNGHMVFTEVRVQQADIVVTADRAEADDLDFGNSSWRFTGSVRIETGMGQIESASAELSFRDHRLVSATAVGEPARFRREVANGESRTVSGTAGRILLDTSAEQITLTESAVVRDGAREVSGGQLLYRMAEDRLIASSDRTGEERVRIIIAPPEEEEASAGDDDADDGTP